MERFRVTKINADTKEVIDDLLAEEVPFTLIIGQKELVTLLCTPEDLEDLVTGFLFTSGLIKKREDIKNIVINREQWAAYIELGQADIDLVFKRLYTSGCGKGTLFYSAADIINRAKITSDLTIKTQDISALMAGFQRKSQIYLKTGGVHSAALADDRSIIVFREDIGRHNAIDKVIGHKLKNGGDFKNTAMITSGRISSEVLLKAQKCKIAVIISKSAPTNQAIKLAKDMGITLVGFARARRMNIYANQERIIG